VLGRGVVALVICEWEGDFEITKLGLSDLGWLGHRGAERLLSVVEEG
jgi:hypothetical protein